MTRTRALLAGGFALVALLILALAAGRRDRETTSGRENASAPISSASATAITADGVDPKGFLYGRVTTDEDATYEGRLRWGGDEEAFWNDTFDGYKDENPWAAFVPEGQLTESRSLEVFGVEILSRDRPVDLDRPFMSRFGDIARIEVQGLDIHVTLKSGTAFDLDRMAADDLADGLRVWDARQGVVDLEEREIRIIDFLPTDRIAVTPARLHGTVRTLQGEFTGYVQWDWGKSVGSDVLRGRAGDGEELSLDFDRIRSIERADPEGALVTMGDDRALRLTGTRDVGLDNRGIFVEDPRFGRVLVDWEAFQRVDFEPAGSGPGYDDFPPGRPLTGSVTTRDGETMAGRLVFDLDESETTETLDAPAVGLHYSIPFGMVRSIVLPDTESSAEGLVGVTLESGDELRLERSGDLGDGNAGLLVFVEDRGRPEYLPWSEVRHIDFDRP